MTVSPFVCQDRKFKWQIFSDNTLSPTQPGEKTNCDCRVWEDQKINRTLSLSTFTRMVNIFSIYSKIAILEPILMNYLKVTIPDSNLVSLTLDKPIQIIRYLFSCKFPSFFIVSKLVSNIAKSMQIFDEFFWKNEKLKIWYDYATFDTSFQKKLANLQMIRSSYLKYILVSTVPRILKPPRLFISYP